MKQNLKNLTVFVCICSVIALLLAFTNSLTAPIIEQNQNAAANDALLEVMPEGKNFEEIDLSTYTLPTTVTEAYKETNCLGAEALPDNHGFDENIWNLEDLSHPKLK